MTVVLSRCREIEAVCRGMYSHIFCVIRNETWTEVAADVSPCVTSASPHSAWCAGWAGASPWDQAVSVGQQLRERGLAKHRAWGRAGIQGLTGLPAVKSVGLATRVWVFRGWEISGDGISGWWWGSRVPCEHCPPALLTGTGKQNHRHNKVGKGLLRPMSPTMPSTHHHVRH